MKIHRLSLWLPRVASLIVATILFGTVSVALLQLDRLSANDAPLRLASQVVAELREGQSATLNAQPHVDLARSLAVFVVVEDSQGAATAGSGFLAGSLVSLPTGVLANAAQTGQNDVTWAPKPGLRFATVTLKVGNQFVSAGQSLAPSDDRSGTIQLLVGAGWLVSMFVFGGTWFWSYRIRLGLQPHFAEQSQAPRSSE